MIKTDVKTALINYHQIKHEIKNDIQRIEILRYRKGKIGGSFAKIPQNPTPRDSVIIGNLCLEDLYLLQLTNHRYQVWIVHEFIKFCKESDVLIKKIVVDLYIYKTRMSEVSEKHSLKTDRIIDLVNNHIDAFVELMNTDEDWKSKYLLNTKEEEIK